MRQRSRVSPERSSARRMLCDVTSTPREVPCDGLAWQVHRDEASWTNLSWTNSSSSLARDEARGCRCKLGVACSFCRSRRLVREGNWRRVDGAHRVHPSGRTVRRRDVVRRERRWDRPTSDQQVRRDVLSVGATRRWPDRLWGQRRRRPCQRGNGRPGRDAPHEPRPSQGNSESRARPVSPDGRSIAREGLDEKNPAAAGIYLTRASDGAIVRRLTRIRFIPGDFSPDGKTLVLFKGPDGQPPPPGSLWVVGRNGAGLRRLSPAKIQVECCFNYRWSPGGNEILFADRSGVIWTIDPDGTRLAKVFQDPKGRYAATPTWSPDGSMIMFALDPTPNPFDHPTNGLYVIHADGSALTEVIGGADFKREPVWVR